MNRLRACLVWLSRVHHCRGFGVQSPTDYRFVRYVVNEHWSYYAYEMLGQNDDWLTRKMGRLYFRLANWLQPATFTDLVDADALSVIRYVQAGCRRTALRARIYNKVELVRTSCADCRAQHESLLTCADQRTVLVVEDIHQTRAARDCWRQLQADERVGTTFDLYYCGIVFFDTQRFKHHYIVNF